MKDYRLIVLSLVVALLFSGCITVEEARRLTLQHYQPTSVSKKIAAAVAIETSVSAPTLEAGWTEAHRQLTAEGLAALFTKPSFKKGADEELLLQVSLVLHDLFFKWTGDITATILDAKTGLRLATYKRTAEGGYTADVFAKLMRQLEGDMVKAFDSQALKATRPSPLQPLPGLQADR